MSNDSTMRRILPQSSHLGQFQFAPQSTFPHQQAAAPQQPRENQRNFVFVDEHNRHKRLKVMRACEGCRRRKIKCDAATTNTWPCSACIRLKLHCIRPNGQYEGSPTETYASTQADYEAMHDGFRQMQHHPHHSLGGGMDVAKSCIYDDVYQNGPYGGSPVTQHNLHYTATVGGLDQSYAPASVFPAPLVHGQPAVATVEYYLPDQYGQDDFAELLGALKVDDRGTAPYLNNKSALKSLEEEPFTEDPDDLKIMLPPVVISSAAVHKIRIPPELMPDDDTVFHYFELYFLHVHPYVPVLNKSQFYQQWHTNRDSVNPLLLEAIFAVASPLAEDPAQGQQWISLASKHSDAFMDVPRLSTLQALLIILKAREASPKKGYYYRSWMSIVNGVTMAKDLGLDEHYEDHKAGKLCDSKLDCLTKTRVWQTIFVCETMIGSSQGREDLSIDVSTIDFSIQRCAPGVIDETEHHVSRNFTYLARIVRNISRMNSVYAKVKRKKDWGRDPEFTQLNPLLTTWMNELPADLNITFPPDGSPPWLPNHFIGNLHSYHYLSVILLHRPQLRFHEPTNPDGEWKSHMMLCYTSAKLLCRLQESMLQSFGLTGLQCMQRGISFTIYAVLSCIVLHLVALTSPDPDINIDARDYFTRHMRILERTMGSWPIPEMVKQIDAVREAFSADTRKPFVLKPSFPYGSPGPAGQQTPSTTGGRVGAYSMPAPLRPRSLDHAPTGEVPNSQVSYTRHATMTPPVSGGADPQSDPCAAQPLVMVGAGQNPSLAPMPTHGMSHLAEASTWNPTRILDQWHRTFGTPPVTAPHTSSIVSSSPTSLIKPQGAPELPTIHHDVQQQSTNTSLPDPALSQQYTALAPVQQAFVTPAMWQESVASVYEGGMKRRWNDYDAVNHHDHHMAGGAMAKRR